MKFGPVAAISSTKFHRHVEDNGIRQAYIKPAFLQLNDKVKRSYSSDQEEPYHLLTFKDDVGLEAKLHEGERFYNSSRPGTPITNIRNVSLRPLYDTSRTAGGPRRCKAITAAASPDP
jgi:hypothetical protein